MTEESTTTESAQMSPEEFAGNLSDLTAEMVQLLAKYGEQTAPHPVSFCAALGQALMFFLDHLGNTNATMVISAEIMQFAVEQMQKGDDGEEEQADVE